MSATKTPLPPTDLSPGVDELRGVLVFLDGPHKGQEFALGREAKIGRDPSCDVAITADATRVSREHAEIAAIPGGEWFIEDLSSGNGTIVNDEPLDPGGRMMLAANDLVQFGDGGPKARFVIHSAEKRHTVPQVGHQIVLARTSGPGDRRLEFKDEALITIGRAPDSHVRFEAHDTSSVSKQHARIRYVAGAYHLEDLESSNGTLVNGEKITSAVLAAGDVIELGPGGPKIVVESLETPQSARETSIELLDQAVADTRRHGRVLFIGVVALLLVGGGVAWAFWPEVELAQVGVAAPQDPTDKQRLLAVKERFQPAVLFLWVGYELTYDGKTVYKGEATGTGFLLSADSKAITARHVVEPWLGIDYTAAALRTALMARDPAKFAIESTVAAWPSGQTVAATDGSVDLGSGYNNRQLQNLRVLGFPPLLTIEVEADVLNIDGSGIAHENLPEPAEEDDGPFPERVQLIDVRGNTDMALLQLEGLAIDSDALLRLTPEGQPPAQGDMVAHLSFPGGSLERTDAVASYMEATVGKVEDKILIDGTTPPGSSGAAVFNTRGEITGVLVQDISKQGDLGAIIPADKIRALLARCADGCE